MNNTDFIIGFSNSKMRFPVFAWLIKKVYDIPYSHVYIRFYSTKYDRWLVYESVGKGARFMTYTNWQTIDTTHKEFTISVTEEQRTKIICSFLDDLGRQYGMKQAFGIGIKALAKRWFNKDINNPFPEHDKEICSEAVTKMLEILGGFKANNEEVTPLDIYSYLLASQNSCVTV